MENMMSSEMTGDAEEDGRLIKFVPFQSAVESAFWVRYCRAKLETIQLSEESVPLLLSYAVVNGGSRLQCRVNSLLLPMLLEQNQPSILHTNNECVSIRGSLIGYNTMEAFQSVDKNLLLRNHFCSNFFGKDDTTILGSLCSVMLITLVDLKNHKVFFWFAFPVLVPKVSIRVQNIEDISNQCSVSLAAAVDMMRRVYLLKPITDTSVTLSPYFLIKKMKCVPLSKAAYDSMMQQGDELDDIIFAFFDPLGHSGDILMMGWPMRNLVAYLCFHLDLGGRTVKILSYRPKVFRRIAIEHDVADDAVLVETPTGLDDKCLSLSLQIPLKEDYEQISIKTEAPYEKYKVVGWELNARAKPGPRSVNLKPLLDPTHLAIQAADLNLKLMKWRMIPDLKIDLLQSSKVLLIGAGTLGCNVARVLLGWGIRHFTIVDYGRVSYSNPVRQSLFTLEDCHADAGSGRPKAVAAAEALKTIAADVHSVGVCLSVPMPGHPESEDALVQSTDQLDKLVQNCDVVFLLTDTRESRWLPTVMAAAHNKVLINAALGLDSWLVIRHGGGFSTETDSSTNGQRHGCYFCNDVVAPENSTKNRTMDQQCTVTRPGLALIAGSMAVEMMVSLLHHPAGVNAPALSRIQCDFSPILQSSDESNSPLGIIPHQIRGSLVTYSMMTPAVPAFNHCTGCSRNVVEAYIRDKHDLVLKTCLTTSSAFLEDLAGLTQFRAEATERLNDVGNWDEDIDE